MRIIFGLFLVVFGRLSAAHVSSIDAERRQKKAAPILKKAIIKPTIKDDTADPDILRSYRPVSNLPVLSKILEKVVLDQLNSYLDQQNLHCPAQSGYRANHSCETLLTRLFDDVLGKIDKGN